MKKAFHLLKWMLLIWATLIVISKILNPKCNEHLTTIRDEEL